MSDNHSENIDPSSQESWEIKQKDNELYIFDWKNPGKTHESLSSVKKEFHHTSFEDKTGTTEISDRYYRENDDRELIFGDDRTKKRTEIKEPAEEVFTDRRNSKKPQGNMDAGKQFRNKKKIEDDRENADLFRSILEEGGAAGFWDSIVSVLAEWKYKISAPFKKWKEETSKNKEVQAETDDSIERKRRRMEAGKKRRRKKSKKQQAMAWITRFAAAAICILLIVIVFSGIRYLLKLQKTENNHDYPEYVQEEYLTVNPYSRPGVEVKEINSIVIHYTANPGSTAKQNRDYFEGLANSGETKASSNFIIGLDGEVIACVPAGEVAYASNNRNLDTISIECCHEDETGEFTQETYDSLVKFSAWLCKEYNLKAKDLIRHYDVTGKICPKYFVENEEAWTQFKKDVAKMIKKI